MPSLKTKFNHKYDYAHALSENLKKIEAWFNLVHNICIKYGIQDDDIYNFDEMGYMLSITTTTKIITAADKQKPK
jgi:hypothetical protein